MSVALLLITHEHIAHDLLTTAQNILDAPIDNIALLEVPMDAPIEAVKKTAAAHLSELSTEDGLLILTDLIGSTPFNIAVQIKTERSDAILISGLNLSMILKLSNYRDLALTDLADKAILGGRTGISKHDN